MVDARSILARSRDATSLLALDPAFDQLHGAIGLFGNGQIVRHHDYSEVLLAGSRFAGFAGSPARSGGRGCRSARRPAAVGAGHQGPSDGGPLHFAAGQLPWACFSRCARPTMSSSSAARSVYARCCRQ